MNALKILLAVSAVFAIGAGATNAEVLIHDTFGSVSPWQDPNINAGLSGRQTGSQQPITWSKTDANNGDLVYLAEYDSTPGDANLFLQGMSVNMWNWATVWASPNKDWIGWDDILFSMDINPVSFGTPTVGYAGFSLGGGNQCFDGGRIRFSLDKAGNYGVYDTVSDSTVTNGSIGPGWHNWAAELKKFGPQHVVNFTCDGKLIMPDHTTGSLTSSYLTLFHQYDYHPNDWSYNASRFDNFTAESVPAAADEQGLFLDDFCCNIMTSDLNNGYSTRQAGLLSPVTWSDMEKADDRSDTLLSGSPSNYLILGTRSFDPAGGTPYNCYAWASPDINFAGQGWIRLSFDMNTAAARNSCGDVWSGCTLGSVQGMNEDKLYFYIYNDYDDADNLVSSKYYFRDGTIKVTTGAVSTGWHHVVIDLREWGPYDVISVALDGTPVVTDHVAGIAKESDNYINFVARQEKTGWTYSQSDFDNIKVVKVLTPQPPAPAYGKSRGILIDRGLQLNAANIDPNAFSKARFDESGFSGVDLTWGLDPTSNISAIGSAPGFQWSEWVGDWSGPDANVKPYMSNLVSLQYYDEQDLFNTDPAAYGTIGAAKSTFAKWRVKYPNVISRTNQSGSQLMDDDLRNYVRTAQPGMIMFDRYSFDGTLQGGSPTALYEVMQRYRTVGLEGYDGTGAYPIPYGQYIQTYRRNGHTPSESEVRLQEFASWAFGYTMLDAFVYSSAGDVLSGLFDGAGDSTPTAAFYYTAKANLESRKLGDTLVRLVSKGLWLNPGQYSSQPSNISAYQSGGVPYLTGVSATNNGTLNGGKSGDVIIGKFSLLDEGFDGSSYTGETYFMVTNGLADPNGSAAQTQQTIRLNFNFGTSGITSLQRISRDTGATEIVPLIHDSGSLYHLDLVLPGGTGDLFKFNTGAIFVGGPVSPISIVDVKSKADGEIVSLSGTVTYASSDIFYIENADRLSGIRVKKSGHGKSIGQGVTVTGTLGTDSNGERFVDAVSITNGTAEVVTPVGMTNKNLGGGDYNYSYESSTGKTLSGQKSITNGNGLNNIGLLAKAWGKATDPDSAGFVLSDGSSVPVKVIVVNPAQYEGKYVVVTGISSMDINGQRLILAVTVQ